MGTPRKGALFPLELLNSKNIAWKILGRTCLRKPVQENRTKRWRKISDTITSASVLRDALSEFLIM